MPTYNTESQTARPCFKWNSSLTLWRPMSPAQLVCLRRHGWTGPCSASQWPYCSRCVVLTCRLQQTWTTSNSWCQTWLVMSASSATSPMKTALLLPLNRKKRVHQRKFIIHFHAGDFRCFDCTSCAEMVPKLSSQVPLAHYCNFKKLK